MNKDGTKFKYKILHDRSFTLIPINSLMVAADFDRSSQVSVEASTPTWVVLHDFSLRTWLFTNIEDGLC